MKNRVVRTISFWLLLLASPWLQAATTPSPVLEVYVREGCPHCADAKAFLPEFASRHPEVMIVYRPVDTDAVARADLIRHSQQAGLWPPGVPTFVYQGRVLSGFSTAGKTGPKIEALLNDQAASTLVETRFGTIDAAQLGLPLFTLALGLIDGFNACAMWVLLFLLSLLVHLRNRLRMALIAGTFVLVSGAVYYAFMAAWLNLFLAVGLSVYLRVALALLALVLGFINIRDFLHPSNGFTLSIPASAKPGLYARMRNIVQHRSLGLALLAAATLAVVVNFIELLCTAGLPALYTAILTRQDLPLASHYAYLGLYIIGYIADDSLMVGTAVLALSSSKLTENTGRWLKLLSGIVMALLGVVMLVQPQWLV